MKQRLFGMAAIERVMGRETFEHWTLQKACSFSQQLCRTIDGAQGATAVRQSRSIMGFRCQVCYANVSLCALGYLSMYETLAYQLQVW